MKIKCAPMNWPIGMGKFFKGVYDLYNDEVTLFETGHGHEIHPFKKIKGLVNAKMKLVQIFMMILRWKLSL